MIIIHKGTGTILAAEECELLIRAPEDESEEATLGRTGYKIPHPYEVMFFDADSVRQHFEDDEVYGDDVAGMTDEELDEVGQTAMRSVALWDVYHEVLTSVLSLALTLKEASVKTPKA